MEKSFEDNLKELETIVNDLESGNVLLDDAIKKYSEAMNIAKECSKKLNEATETVNKIVTENGELKDFNLED